MSATTLRRCVLLLLPAFALGLQVNAATSLRHHHYPQCARRYHRFRPPVAMSAAAAIMPPPVKMPPHFTVKGEKLTPYGILLGISVFLTAIIVQIPVYLAYLWSMAFDKKKRRMVDWIIHFWAKVSMSVCGYVPEVVGLENLPPHSVNCLYVPNHTSFLDILTLTGFIPRPMKYVSKAEILKCAASAPTLASLSQRTTPSRSRQLAQTTRAAPRLTSAPPIRLSPPPLSSASLLRTSPPPLSSASHHARASALLSSGSHSSVGR